MPWSFDGSASRMVSSAAPAVTAPPCWLAACVAPDDAGSDRTVLGLFNNGSTGNYLRLRVGGTVGGAAAPLQARTGSFQVALALFCDASLRMAFGELAGNRAVQVAAVSVTGINRLAIGRDETSSPGGYYDGRMLWALAGRGWPTVAEIEALMDWRTHHPLTVCPQLIRHFYQADGATGRDMAGGLSLAATSVPLVGGAPLLVRSPLHPDDELPTSSTRRVRFRRSVGDAWFEVLSDPLTGGGIVPIEAWADQDADEIGLRIGAGAAVTTATTGTHNAQVTGERIIGAPLVDGVPQSDGEGRIAGVSCHAEVLTGPELVSARAALRPWLQLSKTAGDPLTVDIGGGEVSLASLVVDPSGAGWTLGNLSATGATAAAGSGPATVSLSGITVAAGGSIEVRATATSLQAEDYRTSVEVVALVEVTAAPSDFIDLVTAMLPVGVWRGDTGSTTEDPDLVGVSPLAWVSGAPATGRGTLVNADPDGASLSLTAPVRGSVPHHASHITSSGGVFLVCQFRAVAAKQQLINRYEGANTAGRWLIEMTGTGQITGKMETGSGTVEVSTATGAVAAGVPAGVALTWGPAGLRLYVNSGTPADSDVTTQGAAGDRAVSVGAWYSGTTPFSGLLGWRVLFGAQPGDAEIGNLMALVKSMGVTQANADAFSVAASQSTDVDVLANDDVAAGPAPLITVTQQPALGSLAVTVDGKLRFTAGAVAGVDTTGRYALDLGTPAALTATVTSSVPFFATTDPLWTLRNSDPVLPHGAHPRLSEGVDNFVGHPCTRHSITTGQEVSSMGMTVGMTPADCVLMRWRFCLFAGYGAKALAPAPPVNDGKPQYQVQPDQWPANTNGAKTIGLRDTLGADGGDDPSKQRGYGCRILFAGGEDGTDWTFKVYDYAHDRVITFGRTADSGVVVVPGVWYELGLGMVLNQGDAADGAVRFWVNRQLKFQRTGMRWFPFASGNNGSFGSLINRLHITCMFGGNPDQMIPLANGAWGFRDLQYWTTARSNGGIYLAA